MVTVSAHIRAVRDFNTEPLGAAAVESLEVVSATLSAAAGRDLRCDSVWCNFVDLSPCPLEGHAAVFEGTPS